MDAIARNSTAAAMSSVSGLCDVIDRLVFQNVGALVANNKDGLMQKMSSGNYTMATELQVGFLSVATLPYTL